MGRLADVAWPDEEDVVQVGAAKGDPYATLVKQENVDGARLSRSASRTAQAGKVSAIQILQNPATPTGPELLDAVARVGFLAPLCGAKEVTVLLASLARRALWRSAVTLLFTAGEVVDLVDLPCLGAALQACEKSGQWQMALTLLEDTETQVLCLGNPWFRFQLSPAPTRWRCFGLRPTGNWPGRGLAAGLLDLEADVEVWHLEYGGLAKGRVVSRGDGCCECLWLASLRDLSQQRQWRMATQVLEVLRHDGLQLTVVPFNVWMRWTRPSSAQEEAFGARASRRAFSAWEAHMKVAEELSSCVPDQITLNSVVQSCVETTSWEAAISLVKAAPSWLDVKPDAVSLNTAMSACSGAQEWQQSFALFFDANSLRVAPNVVSFNAAIHATDDWQERYLTIGLNGLEQKRSLCRHLVLKRQLQSIPILNAWPKKPTDNLQKKQLQPCLGPAVWHMMWSGGDLTNGDPWDPCDMVFPGHLRSFSSATGYGFVHNKELQEKFGRDVYVHASLLPAGIVCGAKVVFTLGVNDRGQPQCRQVWEEDTSELDQNAIYELLPVADLEAFPGCPHIEVKEETIRLLSWNILAPSYCNGFYFKDVQSEFLRWSRRAWQIKALLFSLCPDIVCLQEVECQRVGELGLYSYQAEYLQRPAGATGNARLDGCLVAWRADRFRLLRKKALLYDEHLPPKPEDGERGHSGHVALLVELQPVDSLKQPLLVATTHLTCGEEAEELRVAQAKILLRTIEQFGNEQVLLCGDLNSLPNSDTYNFLSQSLHSAYQDLEDDENGLCTATNANVCGEQGFAEIIDYCFLWDKDSLRHRWRPPTKASLRDQLGATASEAVPTLLRGGRWPSDHFPVAVDLVLTAQCLQ
eukprot:s2914_g1.t2